MNSFVAQQSPLKNPPSPDDQRTAIIHLSPEFNAKLSEDQTFADLKKQFALEEEQREVTLNYENFNHQEILTAILSADQLNISSFSVIGHIIHLNLKDEFQPYRSVIGQVLLDKNPSQDLVLNKLDKIDSVYRYFQFDVLARRSESTTTVVQVNENGLRFKMDFAKVYWNPRLSTEHDRIVQLLNDGDVVYDVFAGIGPFAIPAAKRKRCRVLANDLNPESYKYLDENIKLNKVQTLKAYNLDGREFIRETVKEDLVASWRAGAGTGGGADSDNSKVEEQKKRQFHIIMNLPAIAVEFLDAFVGLTADTLDDQTISDLHRTNALTMPTVYCYCFHPYDQDKSQMVANVKSRLNCEAIDDIQTHFVRKVAPAKDMYRLTFRLPQQVLFGACSEPPNKRMKTA